MGKLAGRVALVTGAARQRGIGQGTVLALLREGAAGVVFTDIDDATGAETARVLAREHGERIAYLHHDAASESDWAAVLATTIDRFGRLDILVNNAGTTFPGSIESLSLTELRRGIAINFDSQFIGIKTCAPVLAKFAADSAGGAAIVNNSSMAAYLTDPGNLPYHISKSAVRMLTMCAAREFGPKRIRVNSVHYGPTLTPMMEAALEGYAQKGQFDDVAAATSGITALSPLGIIGTSDDAGALVAFLVSDEARYITGAAYVHDGGCFIHY